MLYIIGLGPSRLEDISLHSLNTIKKADKIILRTRHHPSVAELIDMKINFETCDCFYENCNDFEQVYANIADFCIEQAGLYENIAYIVPGSPLVAEKTVQLLLQKEKEFGNISMVILPALSFLDLVYNRLSIDACDGLRIIDALQIGDIVATESVDMVITQIYSNQVASDVKLHLMQLYPDETPMIFMRNLGLPDESIRHIKLFELDWQRDINHLTTVYLPKFKQDSSSNIAELLQTMQRLCGSEGCMWDREQTHCSIRHNFIEEVYEAIEAIDLQDSKLLCEELGDVLLQIVFHAQMAKENGCFDFQDVIDGINEKLIRRHPHVFGELRLADSKEIVYNWEKIKAQEKQERTSALDGISKGLPALMSAYKMQHKAAKVGFDWQNIEPVYAKIQEELLEVRQAENKQDLEKELGDLLFAVVNLTRHLKINPEVALNTSNNSFRRRFNYIEECVSKSGKNWQDFTLEQLDEFWNQAKTKNF